MGFINNLGNWLRDEDPKSMQRKIDTESIETDSEIFSAVDTSNSSFTTSEASSTDIVSQAYEQFKSGNNSTFDIFNIEKLYANFDGIPEDTKKVLIRKNLVTIGIDLNLLIDEATSRKTSIESIAKEHIEDSERIKKDICSQIAEAKSTIDMLSAKNIETENKLQAELTGAKSEIQRLDFILHILGGDI